MLHQMDIIGSNINQFLEIFCYLFMLIFSFETENGIQAEETGKIANKGSDLEAMRAKGFFKYTGPDNKVYSIMYTADENGFVAQGNHLPTPPPIPDEILKSLNYQRGGGPHGKF